MTEPTTKLTNTKHLIALARAVMQNKDDVALMNGAISERVAHAVEHDNLSAKAFKIGIAVAKVYQNKGQHEGRALRDAIAVIFDDFEAGGIFGDMHVGDLADMAEMRAVDEADKAEVAHVENNARLLEGGIKELPDGEAPVKRGRVRPRKLPAPVDGIISEDFLPEDAGDHGEADADAEFDDATSASPSIRNREIGVGDKPGSYTVQ
jgi:hypothetical protein